MGATVAGKSMRRGLSRLQIIGTAALLVACADAAAAQDGNAIGNPQLRNFQLQPQRRIITEPQPAPVTAPPVAGPPPPAAAAQTNGAAPRQPPPPQAAQPRPTAPPPATAGRQPPHPSPSPVIETSPPATGAAPSPLPAPTQPALPAAPLPEPPTSAPPAEAVPAPTPPQRGLPWLYLVPMALAGLATAAFLLLRRRRNSAGIAPEAAAAPAPLASPPPPPPVLRPWLELALKVEKASATLTETVLSFELELANTGKAAARNLRVDVKMFNADAEQDREIGAFFQTAGRESTKLNLPGIAAGNSGVIRGEVAMKRDDMRALVLEDKYLFVPVIAVNVLYDWGQGRTGQSSKSYVVGRELAQPGAKMGAFRVDQGPRVWRTVGQRQHTMALRV
jgi:hypothetical protein